MAKVLHIAKKKKTSAGEKGRTVAHYLRIYFISVFVGVAVFAIGNYFFQPQPLCANSHTCKSDLSLHIDNNTTGFFDGHTVVPPKIDLARDLITPSVLGTTVPAEEKHIYVDLATQTLYAYEGTKQIMQTLIASGKWGKTPTGNF